LNASPGHLRDTCGFVYSVTPYDPVVYKILVVEMLEEAGVDLLVHNFVDHVETKGNTIKYVEISSKSGRHQIQGSIFIDTKGDADIAYLSGAPTLKGRDEDQKTQPMTMKFRMRVVNLSKVKDYMI
jgi:hypothetical protein